MANLLDQASIVLTPTAYDNGKVLCAKPIDGSGDFDFSRNSAATRVNAQGLVEDVQILSSNLVQNGSFSQIGSEEITNGNFLQEGSELLVNGDFATNSSWSGSATISNGQLTKGASGGLVYQGALDGNVKLWKIIVDVAEKNGASLTLYLGGAQIALNEGIQTLYIKNGTSNTFVGFNNGAGSVINSISVKEVGQNWNFNNWTLTNDNALLVDTGGYINQVGVFVVGKSYKISVNVKDYTSGSLRFDSNGQNLWTPSGSNTIATIYVCNLDRTNFLLEGDFRGTITDISIKEVGQDWEFGVGWGLGENKAISTGSQILSQPFFHNNKIYKYSFEVTDYISGNLRFRIGNGATEIIVSSNGVFTGVMQSAGGLNKIIFGDTGIAISCSVTNISIIEITNDTNLPRINYEGFSYQDALGSELVLNGSFDSNINFWNKGGGNVNPLSWDNGKIKITNDVAQLNSARQTIATEIGKTYKVSADVNSTNGLTPRLASSNPTTGLIGTLGTIETLTYTFIATSTSSQIELFNWQNTIDKYNLWDNVSVKEYLGQEVVPDSGCGSWLFEPQSTNLYINSEPTTNEAGQSGISYETYTINRFTNCIKYGDNSVDRYRYGANTTAGVINTHSYFVLMDDGSEPNVGSSASDDFSILINGAYATTILPSVNYGNGLWRVSGSKYSSVSNSNNGIYKFSTQSVKGFRVFGLQAEALSYSTSYIPTDGTSVTRNRDVCTNGGTGTGLINSTEGVFYAEIAALADDGTYRSLTISDGTDTNRVSLSYTPTINTLSAFVRNTAGAVFSVTTTLIDSSTISKYAIKYKENDFALWVNGVEVATDTSGTTFNSNTLDSLSFDKGNGGDSFYGKTKCVAVWKEALTDLELQELTTI